MVVFFFKIEGKGNCFFEAVLCQLSFMDDEEGAELYKQYHIQCQMVAHVLKHLDLFKQWLRDRIREFYGTGDGNLGPFSEELFAVDVRRR